MRQAIARLRDYSVRADEITQGIALPVLGSGRLGGEDVAKYDLADPILVAAFDLYDLLHGYLAVAAALLEHLTDDRKLDAAMLLTRISPFVISLQGEASDVPTAADVNGWASTYPADASAIPKPKLQPRNGRSVHKIYPDQILEE